VQRKVGPGQYIGSNASDPAFVIGDLSSVWLIANVRETDASKVQVGQAVQFKSLALGGRAFETTISYVTSSVDPNTRRLPVRANLKNAAGALKPEMFANVQVVVGESEVAAAVPRAAVIYEGGARLGRRRQSWDGIAQHQDRNNQ
jgi:cobalt-zinc-cadmium efflux system membrane fusion protein